MHFADRHRAIAAVYIIFRDGDRKILLLKRANTGYFDGSFSLPAGHIDGGESAVEAVVREAKEEVGVDISTTDLQFVHVMHRFSSLPVEHERIDFYFEALKWKNEISNREPHKCAELLWCNGRDLPPKIVSEVHYALQNIEAGKLYSDFNFSVE